MTCERYVIRHGRRGVVHVDDTVTGETVGTWFNADALLNADEEIARLKARDHDRGWSR